MSVFADNDVAGEVVKCFDDYFKDFLLVETAKTASDPTGRYGLDWSSQSFGEFEVVFSKPEESCYHVFVSGWILPVSFSW